MERGRREVFVNVKVNGGGDSKAKFGKRKKSLRSQRLSGKQTRIIDLFLPQRRRGAEGAGGF